MPFSFSFRSYCTRFQAPIRTAHGLWAEREGLILRAVDLGSGGGVGFGEVAPIPWFGTETVERAREVATKLGDRIESDAYSRLPDDLPCLRGALLSAMEESQAASRMKLGDSAPPVTGAAYLSVAALLPAGKVAREKLRSFAEAGFRSFKWKVGVGDARDEWVILDDLLADLPAGGKLRLDANGAWDCRTAEGWLQRAVERSLEFVEQPIAPDARGADDLLLGLAHDFPVPLALDESIATDQDVARWLDFGWPGLFVIKPLLLGDVSSTLARLQTRKHDIVFSSALETAVGARTALTLAFAHAPAGRAIGFGVWPLFADGRFDGPRLAPFVRREDVAALDAEAVWNAAK